MHRIFVTMVFVAAVSFVESAKADPYRWCAQYSGGRFGGGGTNCYFVTLEWADFASQTISTTGVRWLPLKTESGADGVDLRSVTG